MIWIAIIISFIIGYFVGLTELKKVCKKYDSFLMSEEDCNKNAEDVSNFLKKRYVIDSIPTVNDDTKHWKATQGKKIKEEIFGPQDMSGDFGSWWLPNFIRFVDSLQCRLIVIDKRLDEDVISHIQSVSKTKDTEADPE